MEYNTNEPLYERAGRGAILAARRSDAQARTRRAARATVLAAIADVHVLNPLVRLRVN